LRDSGKHKRTLTLPKGVGNQILELTKTIYAFTVKGPTQPAS